MSYLSNQNVCPQNTEQREVGVDEELAEQRAVFHTKPTKRLFPLSHQGDFFVSV